MSTRVDVVSTARLLPFIWSRESDVLSLIFVQCMPGRTPGLSELVVLLISEISAAALTSL